MNNAAPENTAALQEKIAELEQQLKLCISIKVLY